MKLFKASFLIILLGLPLMGGDCGGTAATVKCSELLGKTVCESAMSGEYRRVCEWQVTPAVPVTVAKCEGTPTSACPALKGIASEDMSNCNAVQGCSYNTDTSTCTGTRTTAPSACPALKGIASEDMGNCRAVPGCTYTAPVAATEAIEECAMLRGPVNK